MVNLREDDDLGDFVSNARKGCRTAGDGGYRDVLFATNRSSGGRRRGLSSAAYVLLNALFQVVRSVSINPGPHGPLASIFEGLWMDELELMDWVHSRVSTMFI